MNRLRRWWTRTGAFAREIVAKRVTITTTLGTVLGLLVSADIVPVGASDAITKYVGLGLTLAGVLTGVLWARTGVTPSDPAQHPVSNNGETLVPLSSVPYDAKHDIED